MQQFGKFHKAPLVTCWFHLTLLELQLGHRQGFNPKAFLCSIFQTWENLYKTHDVFSPKGCKQIRQDVSLHATELIYKT